MTDKEIQQLTDRYLEGSTSPDEELLLARELQRPDISEEWQAVRLMLGGLALGEAEYDAMMDRRKASAHRRPAPRRRWWWVAAAACIVALLSLHAIYDNVKTKPLAEEARVSPKAPPSAPEGEAPPSAPEGATIAQPLKSKTIEAPSGAVGGAIPSGGVGGASPSGTARGAEDLAACIARLEAEMENIDDSVSAAHLEKLIAADARLQQLVLRIVGRQTEQALNETLNDSTANYINF
jgi:hypothetical protein